MKKNLVLLVVFILSAIVSTAQSGYEDVVYLKNGSIIHGTIIEQIPNESIKIQTKDQNIFVFNMNEILKISKEETKITSSRSSQKRNAATKDNLKKSGYTNITELTFGRTLNNTSNDFDFSNNNSNSHFDDINNGPLIGIQTVNGYQFSPFFTLGLGVGIHIHSGLVLVPFFADVRVNFLRSRVTPFASFSVGHSFSRKEVVGGILASDDLGGIFINPAMGVKFFALPKFALNFSLGFRYQEIEVTDESYQSYTNERYETRSMRHLNLRFGFTF